MSVELKPGQRIATCRQCGARGIEDADDIAPGICPQCLDRSLATVEAALLAEYPIDDDRCRELLRGAGLTESAIENSMDLMLLIARYANE